MALVRFHYERGGEKFLLFPTASMRCSPVTARNMDTANFEGKVEREELSNEKSSFATRRVCLVVPVTQLNGHDRCTKNRRCLDQADTPPPKHANPVPHLMSEGVQPQTPHSILEEDNGAAE